MFGSAMIQWNNRCNAFSGLLRLCEHTGVADVPTVLFCTVPRITCAEWVRQNLQIRMLAGFADIAERKEILVAGVRFELTTFGL
jgi:hypothetical protein